MEKHNSEYGNLSTEKEPRIELCNQVPDIQSVALYYAEVALEQGSCTKIGDVLPECFEEARREIANDYVNIVSAQQQVRYNEGN